MKPQAGDGMTVRLHARGRLDRVCIASCEAGRAAACRLRGFSLAELMIALAILAIGLLVIGTALPAGVRYTKDSGDQATAVAAAQYALDVIERWVCLRREVADSSGDVIREACLFRPRNADGSLMSSSYEPVIKVRSLYTQNVSAKPGNVVWGGATWGMGQEIPYVDMAEVVTENAIRQYLVNAGAAVIEAECDPAAPNHWLRPVIPSVSTVYPPISAVNGLTGEQYPDYYVGHPSYRYLPRRVQDAESRKALDRHITWTAFYRRASYSDDVDPALYEFVVVVVRRVAERQRFQLQNASSGGADGAAVQLKHMDAACTSPVPFLVTFTGWSPKLQAGVDYDAYTTDPDSTRVLTAGFTPPATLTFHAGAAIGALLPKGSIFIPAANDRRDPAGGFPQATGFVPSAPDALPIYEVIDRVENAGGTYDIIVKNNGYYPWTASGDARYWPVWVIPPAVEEVTPGPPPVPVYSDRSPILTVMRRYIHLRELP